MVDRTPHHHPALVALRRLERALCVERETEADWRYARARTADQSIRWLANHPDEVETERKAWAAYSAALDELRAARFAAADLLTREGFTPENDKTNGVIQ